MDGIYKSYRGVEAGSIKVENIRHTIINGVASTIYDVYLKDGGVWAFSGRHSMEGTIKREGTIVKRLTSE